MGITVVGLRAGRTLLRKESKRSHAMKRNISRSWMIPVKTMTTVRSAAVTMNTICVGRGRIRRETGITAIRKHYICATNGISKRSPM